MPDGKTQTIQFRINPDDGAILQLAADLCEVSRSRWIRQLALAVAAELRGSRDLLNAAARCDQGLGDFVGDAVAFVAGRVLRGGAWLARLEGATDLRNTLGPQLIVDAEDAAEAYTLARSEVSVYPGQQITILHESVVEPGEWAEALERTAQRSL